MNRILLVDDNRENCELYKDIIEAWNYEVLQAFHGMEALQMAEHYMPDLILLDVMLPGLNGFEVCQRLRNNRKTKDIRIVMLTVLSDVADRLRSIEVEANYFLSKPVDMQELKSVIHLQMKKKETDQHKEDLDSIIQVFMNMLKLKDEEQCQKALLYMEYCEKVTNMLPVSNETIQKIHWSAGISSISLLLDEREHKDWIKVLEPLSVMKKIGYILHRMDDQERMTDESLEVALVRTVKQFVDVYQRLGDKKLALDEFKKEMVTNKHTKNVINILEQVLNDEIFYQKNQYHGLNG